jgi:uncharacterized protein with ParB-like and HNH nuclease domain
MKTQDEQNLAEEQLQNEKEPVNYDTREYPVEVLVDKYSQGEFVIPKYQRNFVWEKDIEKMSKFIESILLDLPIPYLFFADDLETGKLEIVDGSQRIRTLTKFKNNDLELEGLEVLDLFNGFKFSDLTESRKRRFLRKTLRSIELTEKASSSVRRDLFARINTKPYDLNPMEVRRGLFDGNFLNFISACANDKDFLELCPISNDKKTRREGEELVLRFFAYTEEYKNFEHSVEDFIDDFIKNKHENGFNDKILKDKFDAMLQFVKDNFDNGFRKSPNSKSTPRGRFEAIAVGVILAIESGENLNNNNVKEWIDSDEFKTVTTSDAANNKSKLIERIEFVKNK